MSFDRSDFRGFTSHVLRTAGLHSASAVELLLGTCAKESDFGKSRRQIGGGPALGVMQMEPATFGWLQGRYSSSLPELIGRNAEDLVWDDRLSVIMARLRYLVVPSPLPPANDVEGMARYWKQHYNTPTGRGTVEEFIANYNMFVLGPVA